MEAVNMSGTRCIRPSYSRKTSWWLFTRRHATRHASGSAWRTLERLGSAGALPARNVAGSKSQSNETNLSASYYTDATAHAGEDLNDQDDTSFKGSNEALDAQLPVRCASHLKDLGKLAQQQPIDVQALGGTLQDLKWSLTHASPRQLQQVRQHPAVRAGLAAMAGIADSCPVAAPIDLSRVIKAAAFLGVKFPRQALECIGAFLADAVPESPAQESTRWAWALSRLGFCPPRLLSAIEAQVLSGDWLQHLDLDGQASLVWVCKRASYRSPEMLAELTRSIAESAVSRSHSGGQGGRARHLSLALYCCASLRYTPPPDTLRQLCSSVRVNMPGCSPQGLSYIAWSLSQMSHHDAVLMNDLTAAAMRKMQRFNCHELARLTSGFAGLNHPHPELLAAAAHAAIHSSSHCSPRDLSHILSSLAKFGVHPGDDTIKALEHHGVALLRHAGKPVQGAKRAKHRQEVAPRGPALTPAGGSQSGPEFSPSVLCWVLWSMVKLGWQPRALVRATEEAWRRSPVLLYQLGPEDVGRLLWALGRLNYRAKFLGEVELVLRRQLGTTPPQSLAMTLHGFATLGITPHELLDGAVQHMAVHLQQYPPQSVASSVWSLAKMGVHPGRGLPEGGFTTQDGVPLMTAIEEFAVRHAEQLNAQAISMLCWGLATLQHHPGYAFLDTMATNLARHAQQAQQQQQQQEEEESRRAGQAGHLTRDAVLHSGRQEGRHHKGGASTTSGRGLGQGVGVAVGSPTLQALSLVSWAFAQWSHPDVRLHSAVRACLLGEPVQPPSSATGPQVGGAADTRTLLGGVAQEGAPLGGGGWEMQGEDPPPQQGFVRGAGAGMVAASGPSDPSQGGGAAAASGGALEGRRAATGGALGGGGAPPASISNIAFALAKLGVRDAELVAALRVEAEQGLDGYNAQELVNLLWCHAALGVQPPLTFLAAATAALGCHLHSCDASLAALVVHSMAVLRYAPPDDWLDEAVQCVAVAVQECLDDDPEHLEDEGYSTMSGAAAAAQLEAQLGRAQHDTSASPLGRAAGSTSAGGTSTSTARSSRRGGEPGPLQSGGGDPPSLGVGKGSRGGRQQQGQLRRSSTGVHVSLISKLLWGCAELGYRPPAHLLAPIVDSAHWGLSHSRGRSLVLPAPEKVRLLWALSILEQYGTSLYRNLSFQVSRMPWGVPHDPSSVQLLRQVVMLSNCETRFITVPLRGSTLLPEWMKDAAEEGGALGQEASSSAGEEDADAPSEAHGGLPARGGRRAGRQRAQQENQADSLPVEGAPPSKRASPSASGTLQRPQRQQRGSELGSSRGGRVDAGGEGAQGGSGLPSQLAQARDKEGREEAEVLAQALQEAGCQPVAVRQLLFGDWVVVYRFRDSGQSAVLPWLPQQRTVNDERRLVGSAQATLRVLAAKGLPVVLGQQEVQGTVVECLDLWT